jgi:thymidylate kinase
MLIVEGPDCVGKTVLCQKLLERLPTHIYAHFTRLPDRFDYYWGYVERISGRVVQDRFHMSEVVYSHVLDRGSNLDAEKYRLLDGKLRTLGAFTVLICAEHKLIESRWDNSQMFSLEKTLRAARSYDAIAEGRGMLMDVDYIFHCSEGVPYVTDGAIGELLGRYLRRQAVAADVASRRPPSL